MLRGEATECLRDESSDGTSDVDEQVLLLPMRKLKPLFIFFAAQTDKPTHRGFLACGRAKLWKRRANYELW